MQNSCRKISKEIYPNQPKISTHFLDIVFLLIRTIFFVFPHNYVICSATWFFWVRSWEKFPYAKKASCKIDYAFVFNSWRSGGERRNQSEPVCSARVESWAGKKNHTWIERLELFARKIVAGGRERVWAWLPMCARVTFIFNIWTSDPERAIKFYTRSTMQWISNCFFSPFCSTKNSGGTRESATGDLVVLKMVRK